MINFLEGNAVPNSLFTLGNEEVISLNSETICSSLSFGCHDKTLTKGNLGIKCFIWLTVCSLS